MTLEERILSKGFKSVDIESPDKECNGYYIRIWFDFKWNETGRIALGKQEIDGNTEKEILKNIDEFIDKFNNDSTYSDWTLLLKNKIY